MEILPTRDFTLRGLDFYHAVLSTSPGALVFQNHLPIRVESRKYWDYQGVGIWWLPFRYCLDIQIANPPTHTNGRVCVALTCGPLHHTMSATHTISSVGQRDRTPPGTELGRGRQNTRRTKSPSSHQKKPRTSKKPSAQKPRGTSKKPPAEGFLMLFCVFLMFRVAETSKNTFRNIKKPPGGFCLMLVWVFV